MKVSGIGGTSGPGEAKKAGKTEKSVPGAFAKHLASSPDSVEDAGILDGAVAISGVEALIAAQDVGDTLSGERRRLITYGETLLDQLDEIRHGLLVGSIPQERLIRLGRQLRERRGNASDPRLAVILDEIELRVEVELAKLSARRP